MNREIQHKRYLFTAKLEPRNPMDQNVHQSGFSMLEVLIVIAILGILLTIAIPAYENYLDQENITSAKADILEIQGIIDKFYVSHNRFPADLSEINQHSRHDPWGKPYYYTNVSTLQNKGSVRKDKNLTPVNSDYDLYSAGKDGNTQLPFTAGVSRDDIVRCNNGSYIGLAMDY